MDSGLPELKRVTRFNIWLLNWKRRRMQTPLILRNKFYSIVPLMPWHLRKRNISDWEYVKLPYAVRKDPRRFAVNTSTPAWILEALCHSEDRSLYYSKILTGFNTSTPADGLTVLAESKDLNIQASVAANVNTPVEVLEWLSVESDNYIVLISLAANSSVPDDSKTLVALKMMQFDS